MKVNFSFCNVGDLSVKKIVENCENLSKVIFSGTKITDKVIKKLNDRGDELEYLDISEIRNLDKEEVDDLVLSCSYLKYLNLSFNRDIDDKTLTMISASCDELETLILKTCPSITESGLISILSQCKNIHKMKIGGSEKIDLNKLMVLQDLFPKVKITF